MIHIQDIKALEILDSRGNPTVQVTLATESFQAKSKVPSGASTGIHEALELRDQDPSRFHGKGVQKAIYNIMEVIRPEILGHEFSSQEEFDALLLKIDGTDNKQNLGANSILACSMAFNRLLAQAKEQELYQNFSDHFSLPTPMVNVLNGGQHADNGLEIQEFMIVPFGIEEFSEKIRAACEIFHCLKSLLKEQSKATSVGDEGGFAPKLGSNDEALQLLSKAVEQAGYKLKTQIGFALDVAASEFYEEGKYNYEGQLLSSNEFADKLSQLVEKHPLISVEDPFAEDDWEAWQAFTQKHGQDIQIVGDDLLVTNIDRLKKAVDTKACNAILIKLNQIGSVTETLQAIDYAKEHGFKVVISHRSGETSDTFIADLAVGTNAGQIKTGSMSRSDRVAKYNRLLEINQNLES